MAVPAPMNRRSVAPPPPPPVEEAAPTLFDYIVGYLTAIDPNFAQQGQNEEHNDYLTRIATFIAPGPNGGMDEENWANFDPQAQQWYEDAAQAIVSGQLIPPPDGFYDAPEEPVQQAAPQPPATRGMNPAAQAGLARYRAEQAAAKAAASQSAPAPQPYSGNGHAVPQQRTAAPPAPVAGAPMRRFAPGAPQQAPATQPPAGPQRRLAPAPAPAPVQQGPMRRAAPGPAQAPAQPAPERTRSPRSQDQITDLRAQVVFNPAITGPELVDYARSQGYQQKDASVTAIISNVRTMLTLLDSMGRLAPPPPG